MSRRFVSIVLAATALILAACAPPATYAPPPTPTPTATPTPFPESACGWQWAYQDRPELSEQWRAALTDRALPIFAEQTSAYAFGENCFGPNGEVIRFAALEIDLNVALPVNAVNDPNECAAYVEPVIRLAIDSFAGVSPKIGFVEFLFKSVSDERRLRVPIQRAEAAFAEGQTGIAFYNAVTSQP